MDGFFQKTANTEFRHISSKIVGKYRKKKEIKTNENDVITTKMGVKLQQDWWQNL